LIRKSVIILKAAKGCILTHICKRPSQTVRLIVRNWKYYRKFSENTGNT